MTGPDLIKLREQRGLSVADVASATGFSIGAINALEAGVCTGSNALAAISTIVRLYEMPRIDRTEPMPARVHWPDRAVALNSRQ